MAGKTDAERAAHGGRRHGRDYYCRGSGGRATRGEVRELPVYGPGGYVWLPENGAEVLVIKGGPGGEEQCVAGTAQSEAPRDMQPGEIYLHGPGGSSVYLRENGVVDIRGRLMINGIPYTPCQCGMEA